MPIDIGICGVNLRLPTSHILAELFFACWRCTELASEEANCSGSTQFAKAGCIQVQQDKG